MSNTHTHTHTTMRNGRMGNFVLTLLNFLMAIKLAITTGELLEYLERLYVIRISSFLFAIKTNKFDMHAAAAAKCVPDNK